MQSQLKLTPRVPVCPIWGLYVILMSWKRDLLSTDMDQAILVMLVDLKIFISCLTPLSCLLWGPYNIPMA